MNTLVCTKCKRELPVSEFFRNTSKGSGYMSACKLCTAERKKVYHKSERGKATIAKGKHTRRMLFRPKSALTAKQWEWLLKEWDYKCAYCGKDFRDNEIPTRDCVVPVSRGGDYSFMNVVPACHSCNSKKRDSIAKPGIPLDQQTLY